MVRRASVTGDEKAILHAGLVNARDVMPWKLEGLNDAEMRRPMTRSGTNLLGLVKHLAGLEYGYLGEVFGRPASERLPWVDDGTIWRGADMWVGPGESTDYITGLYSRACRHADRTVAELDLDDTGTVSWWKEGERETTLRHLLVRMHGETARHAGHADIVRELIDGSIGGSREDPGVPEDADEAWWREYVAPIAAASEALDPDSRRDE